jgi:hypothetical protein
MYDRLYLTKKGNESWAEAITPALAKMLRE